MSTYKDKMQESKSLAVENDVSTQQSLDAPALQFVDNRPEAVMQHKLQEMANNSPQTKRSAQLQARADNYSSLQASPIQKKDGGGDNKTGIPDNLKSGIENLSGYSMDHVKVHYNSDKPSQLKAHAYAQGADIHIARGQEKYLPHEAWHVVQQKQGRVKPTMQVKGKVNINDDIGLEKEADVMGEKANRFEGKAPSPLRYSHSDSATRNTTQRRVYTLGEMDDEPNLVSLEVLEAKIKNLDQLAPNEARALVDFAQDNEEHIFSLNSERMIEKREAQAVINVWPTVDRAHPITAERLVIDIIAIKQELKQGHKKSIKWLSPQQVRKMSVEVSQKWISTLPTSQKVKQKMREGYGMLVQKIMKGYRGNITLVNATFLKEWALTTEYFKMGIPVWESDIKGSLQTREDLDPHKLRESSIAFQLEDASKILSDKEPGFYAFIVPLSFPFKKKIKIGPKPNVQATYNPTESEGHSALSTKDKRKETGKEVTLVKGVLFAGSVTIGQGGKVLKWTNDSGHYTISRKGDKDIGDSAGVLTGEALEAMGFPFPMDKYLDIQ